MARRDQPRVHPIREHVAGPPARHRLVQAGEVRQAAAEDHHVGIEDVHDRRQRARHPVLVAAHRRLGDDVAGGGPGRDLRGVERLTGGALVVAREAGSRQVGLDAPGLPAVARRSRTLVEVGPRQRVVSELARDRVGAGPDPAVHHDPASGAGTHDHAEDGPGAGGGAVHRLRERETVGVVRKTQGPGQHAAQVLGQRPPVQPDRVRVLHEAGSGGDRAGHADAHHRRRPQLALEVLDQGRDRPERRRIVVPGRGHAAAGPHRSVVFEDGGLDLGAPEVDADPRGQGRTSERPSRAAAYTSAAARTVPAWMLTVSAGLDA